MSLGQHPTIPLRVGYMPTLVRAVEALRRADFTTVDIAIATGLSQSKVHRLIRRIPGGDPAPRMACLR